METKTGMNKKIVLTILAAGLILLVGNIKKIFGTEPAGKSEKIPVILDTDISDDIDDTWALAFLLQSPEFDVKLITTAVGDTAARAKVVAKILETAGRTDIPIGIGVAEGDMKKGHRQDEWVKDFDMSKYAGKVYTDGIQAMIDTIMNSPKQITLIAVGPLPNVAEALKREPNIAKKAKFVGMQGSVHRGFRGSPRPEPEYNVKTFIKASQVVFSAGWEMTITPLDTCSLVVLKGEKYKKVLNSDAPLAKAVIENYRVWLNAHNNKNPADINNRSSILFDTVAVYLAMKTDFLEMENNGIRVADDGMTAIDPNANKVNCAVKWKDLGGYENFLVERLTK